MKTSKSRTKKAAELPKELAPLFWDCDFATLRWRAHRDFIIGRVLESGTFDDWKWLRSTMRDFRLRSWIIERSGRGLSKRQLRYWELILDLPHATVNRWMAAPALKLWESRHLA